MVEIVWCSACQSSIPDCDVCEPHVSQDRSLCPDCYSQAARTAANKFARLAIIGAVTLTIIVLGLASLDSSLRLPVAAGLALAYVSARTLATRRRQHQQQKANQAMRNVSRDQTFRKKEQQVESTKHHTSFGAQLTTSGEVSERDQELSKLNLEIADLEEKLEAARDKERSEREE